MLKNMTEKHTDLSPTRGALGIPNDFIIGKAVGDGDCFFDSVAQGMNQLPIPGGPFDVKSLRKACFQHAECNQGAIYDSQSGKTWRQAIEEDAVAGKYATNSGHEETNFYIYMAHIRLTAVESSNLGAAVWGRPEIEGHMLCQMYSIKLHLIEKLHSDGQEVIGHQLVDSSRSSKSVDENTNLYNDPHMIHILNEGLSHFVPILHKTSVPNKPIEKRAHSSLLEGVQPQDNPTDLPGAASPQQVSLSSAQPDRLEHVAEKTERASEAKTHQAIDGRYLKECSLSDKSTWSVVAAEKEDADFKILRITNSPTVSTALDFMQQADFYETFNQASHWFFVVIQVDDCSEFPSEALECLVEFLDEKKPVIIQWDVKPCAKHLVFFKEPGHRAFTPVEMDSDCLFTTEDELTLQLSNKGSFKLPLLLNALKLGIGGQFKGEALDLLKVGFDVKQEIDTWRLIDYAARDDDSLSLRFLLLVDWDLAYQNEDRRRTLEIAAEYGGPQSLSALLNLPITSSAEELFLTDSKKEFLALRDGHGDNPLLIAAQNGRSETLQFLIWCGADIHYHRPGNEKVTAIALAWDRKSYENVWALLEADSPFPEHFDLSGLEESENTTQLMKQVKERRSFHQAIMEGSINAVKAFIKSHTQLKCAYDPSNQCALTRALTADQYEIYALLKSEGFSAGRDEELSVVLGELTSEQRHRLKQANKKYVVKQRDFHIDSLLSKSTQKSGKEDNKNFVRKLYNQLDAIPEISTILKVVEHSERTEIIFDFNRDSFIDLDPTHSSATKGACDYRAGRIYVGAKVQSELLGTLAHELTHLAMQVCYDNECSPYEALDEQKKCAFDKIVAQYRDKTGIDPIIQRVFTVYKESDWPSELIVRVPHLLAYYRGEQNKQQLTRHAPELFDFYEQQTQEDLRRFIENPARIKARHQIQRLNKLLGKMDEIEQSKIWLHDKCLLNDDVINCQKIQILSSPLPRLTILNLYQVLRKKQLSVSDIKSDYIFVSAEQFKNKEKAETIFEVFQSVLHPALIVDCSYENDRSGTDLLSTVNSFSEKRRIIFIAVTDVAQSLYGELKYYQPKIMHDRVYGWSDLTPDSQNELLKNTVCFQGSRISLNQLMSADSPLTNSLPLADLLSEKTLEIGKDMLTSTTDGYIENYYIDRTFSHQVAIKQDIFEQKLSDLVATTEDEFRQLCQSNPQRNVHWLLKDKSGKLIWQQSQGSLKALHEYIDIDNPQVYPPENLDKFLQEAQCQKVMLIADTAGMGKTTVLTHLSKQIKQKYPTYWVVKIDLTDHTDVLEAQVKQNIWTNEFLSEKLLQLESPFEKELFTHCLQGLEKKTKVVLMFDGFDEISPKYKETVLDLLQAVNPLKQPSIEQLWVTSRPHMREALEDHLQQLCYTLEPFSKDDQVGFLTKFWYQAVKLQEVNQQRLEIYATRLIKRLSKSIRDRDKAFTGIPLQTRMLAEGFQEEVKAFHSSHKSEPELPEKLCLVDLYETFILTKLNIFKAKGKISEEQDAKNVISEISPTKNHQKLALEILFPELEDTVLKLEKSELLTPEAIARIGIVQYVDDKPHFIHRTFAEYYVADFLVKQLTKENSSLSEVQDALLKKILLEADYQVIRFFLDGLLLKYKPSEVNLKLCGEQIYNVWRVKQNQLRTVEVQTALHQAAADDNAYIIEFLFSGLKSAGHSDTINNLLLHKGSSRNTAWHLAAERGNLKTLETLWDWAREVQLNLIDLLLAKDNYGRTAWQRAALNGRKEILETLWGWARKVQLNLKDDVLLAKHKDRQTLWHLAADYGKKEVLETLWGWGREVQLNLKDDLLLARDEYGKTAWHIAAFYGWKEILEKLWGWGREVQLNLKDDLLLAIGRNGETAWNIAAEHGRKEILETLWGWGREVQLNLKDDLLLARGRNGETAWNIAADHGRKEILETLWGWAREVQLNLKDDLLLAKDRNGKTAWHIAAFYGWKEILEKLWVWAREVQINFKYDLLLAKDEYGQTAWNIAAKHGKKEILETLWGWAREMQINLKDNLLLSKDEYGHTAWLIAASYDRKEILEKLWGWGTEAQLNLKDDLLLAKDGYGQTAWHIAAFYGWKEILEKLWVWAREVQINFKDDLLLAKDEYGQTAWNIAAMCGKKEILETLWGWAREMQNNLKDDLLLSKDDSGYTA